MSVFVICGRSSDASQYGPFADAQAAVAWINEAHCVFIQTLFPVARVHYRLCAAGRPKRLHLLRTLARSLPPEAGDGRNGAPPNWGHPANLHH